MTDYSDMARVAQTIEANERRDPNFYADPTINFGIMVAPISMGITVVEFERHVDKTYTAIQMARRQRSTRLRRTFATIWPGA